MHCLCRSCVFGSTRRSQIDNSSGVFVCRTDECWEAGALGQIVDPARRSAGFHVEEVDFALLEECLQVPPLGSCIQESEFPSVRVKKAAHGIEFAEIKCEDFNLIFLGIRVEIL